MTISIRQATSGDATWLQSSFDTIFDWKKPDGYFEGVCQLQDQNKVVLLFAVQESIYLGHCKVVWQPHYPHFKSQGIPEIQDLNVRPDYRRQGIASQLLDEAEKRIQKQSDKVGIGFGLYADYGAAQRLYVKRGYIPDGHGVYYNSGVVTPGESYPVDDDLVLYLVKSF